ncbi:hypothetical protein [Catenibacillus scindens]|uniref:hypothetical protein n=1 Tax=Catenibacillus scindens TaxID=673271 RepID=UPI00320B6382
MDHYDSELSRLQQDIVEKKRTEVKLEDLYAQQRDLGIRVDQLRKEKIDEQEDVDRLQNRSLKALFYRVTGKIGEKLTKEQEEAYAAAVKYDAAEGELQAVNEDIDHCKKILERLMWCEQEYGRVFDQKLEQMKASGSIQGQKILELEKEAGILKGQKKEVDEAIAAGNKAKRIAGYIIADLDSAKSWSTVDLIGGGILADIVKYDKLDNVQKNVKELQNALRNFRTELADVKAEIPADLHPEIGDFLHFADYFLDGLFIDWVVRDKISESQKRAGETFSQIQKIMERLEQIDREIMENQEKNSRALKDIVTEEKI